jgi:hypothetical protein
MNLTQPEFVLFCPQTICGVCKTKKLIVKGVDRMARIIWASQYGSEHFSKDQSGAGKLHLYLITSGT